MNDLEEGADALVRVEDLRKNYDALTAVDGISFAIRRGEIFGLLGPNGAGKTTTISMLAGILPSTSGAIVMEGIGAGGTQNASGDAAAQGVGEQTLEKAGRKAGGNAAERGVETRRMIGVVPQELAIYNRMTGRENLAFFGELYGLRGRPLQSRITEMLALVGLADRADDRAEAYSGGMKRRLNLAVGLMHSPRLLLMDEPTVGVDPQSRNHIFEGVRALNRAGLTVLYTSHYMEEVQALCDRVGIMDGGKLIACGPVQELIATLGSATIEVGVADRRSVETLLPRLRGMEHIESVESVKSMEDIDSAIPNAVPNAADAALRPPDTAPPLSGMACLLIRTRRPNLALPAVVAMLNALNLPLLSLNVKQPSLESVFLALTGKTLRD